MKSITIAERRALEAVQRGEVRRIYRKDGNVFRAPAGLGAAALWKLNAKRMICDGHTLRDVVETEVRVRLTAHGLLALDCAPVKRPPREPQSVSPEVADFIRRRMGDQ